MSEEKNKPKEKKEEGIEFALSYGEAFSTISSINAQKVSEYKHNVYAAGLARKQNHLIFTDHYTLSIENEDGESDEKLEKRVFRMLNSVDLQAKMEIAYGEIFWNGIGLFNDVWEYRGNEYILTKLRHLPSETFSTYPYSASPKIYSSFLPGIIVNEKNEIEYWQTTSDNISVKIKKPFVVKDPASEGFAGTSIILPLVPILEMLKYTWHAEMQVVQRTGAPILFVRLKNPGKEDVKQAKNLIKKWGKDVSFLIRDAVEFPDPKITNESNNLEVINFLHNVLIDYLSPTSSLSHREGTLIGGSDKPREEMILKYISGIHLWLAGIFSRLPQQYLEWNGYKGYTATIHIPTPSIDRSELQLEQAKIGAEYGWLKGNEIRERLGAVALDDEGLEELKRIHERRHLMNKEGGVLTGISTGTEGMMETVIEPRREVGTGEDVSRNTHKELEDAIETLSKEIITALENE